MDEKLNPVARTFNGVEFRYRFMVAGGIIKTIEQAEKFIRADAIHEWGSFSTDGGPGNGGRDYFAFYPGAHMLSHTLNSLGLPNPGMAYAEVHAPRYIKQCEKAGIPPWINISGNGVDDTLSLLRRAVKAGFRVITVNGACPNKIGQPILCDDSDAIDEFFARTDAEFGNLEDRVLLWKMSCGMRRPALEYNRERFRRSRAIIGVITGNTIPNGLDYFPDGKTAIQTSNGISRGGLAGPAILPIALDHTEFMMQDVPEGKFGIGCGGATGAASAAKFIRAGATFVQSNSAVTESNGDPDFVRDTNIALQDQFMGLMS